MQIRTLDFNKYRRKYDIKEVTNFNIDGLGTLFDPSIFGYGEERKTRCGYIDLAGPFIDPSTFDISRRLFRELTGIVDGTRWYKIGEKGELIESTESDGGRTGLQWLYDNFDRIKFTKLENTENNRTQTKKMKKAYTSLTKKDFFIKFMIVIPLHYRDIDTSSATAVKVDELNQYYMDLIKACNFKRKLNSSSTNTFFIDTKIQGILMNIYNYISNMLFGKEGSQRQLAMGRSIDNASRIVMVAPEVKPSDTIGKCRHGLDMVQIPLHHILNMHPVHTVTATLRVLRSFMENGLMGSIDIDDFESYYTDEWIKSVMETFTNTFSHRLDNVPTPNDGTIDLLFDFTNEDSNEKTKIIRPLTYMDLFYLAASLYIENSRFIITRYPIIGKDSLIYMKGFIITLNKGIGHMDIYLPGNEDKPIFAADKYPDVFPYQSNYRSDIFHEVTILSNCNLAGLDGDYDKISLS